MPTVCPQCEAEIPADAPAGVCPRCLVGAGFDSATGNPSSAGTASGRPAFVPPLPEELAEYFPELELLNTVGSGGMGAVYRARQLRLDRIVALKIMPSEFGQDPTFAERFAREAQAMARLSHPNIVLVFDFGEANGMPYLVMEFVDGVDLRNAIQSGKVQPEQAVKIIPQICDALQYAHDIGIVHRDIKPENVLLDNTGRVKIADFGLAKLLGTDGAKFTLTGSRQVMGTPHYMAPEQMDHPNQVDHRADIYALGVVFYELLTGELPRGRFAPPSQKAAVDARLDQVVNKTLESEPDRRYQTAGELKTDVDALRHDALYLSSSHTTFKQVCADGWQDILASRKGLSQMSGQIVALGLCKWLAFAVHVFCFYQLVQVVRVDQETKSLGWWMTKSHRNGAPLEFINAPALPLVWFAAGVSAYFLYWRIRKTETGSSGGFHYPLRYTVTWVLTIAYGVGVVLDSAESFIPSSTVLVVLFLLLGIVHQLWNRNVVAWKSPK